MEINIIKNMQSAPYMGSRFGQDVEPKGTYVIQKHGTEPAKYPWVDGKAVLENPLFIDVTVETLIKYKYELAKRFKAKGKQLTNKLMDRGYDAIVTRFEDGSTGEIILFPNAKFTLDMKNESKLLIKNLLREYIEQADKIYFKSGKLTPEDRQFVLSITNGDAYTRLVADWLYHLTKIWGGKLGSDSTSKMLKSFYKNLKTYDKNVFPVHKDLDKFTALTDERGGHILDLYSMLENRNYAIEKLKSLPSIAIRNLKKLIREPQSNEYGFKSMGEKLGQISRNIQILPEDENKKQQILNKIFASKNSLDQMVELSSHFANAFNPQAEETSKDELIDNLEYVDAELIQNTDNIVVIKVNSNEAMRHVGCTSTWCFSQPNSSGYWDDYASLGYVYVIFNFDEEFDDAKFMMVFLPDSGSLYTSMNQEFSEINLDGYEHLQKIGVNMNLLNAYNDDDDDDDDNEQIKSEPKKQEPYKDPNQLSLFEIRQKLREGLLVEVSGDKTITAYHGSPNKIMKFVDEFVGGKDANDQEGPGIYFTSSFDNAGHYGEYVHKVKLTPRKLLTTTPSSNKIANLIKKMVLMAPDWEEKAQDWDENPNIGLREFITSTINYNDTEKDVAQQIWYDFYRYDPVDFVRNMVKMGIDGLMIPKEDGMVHYIIYNPSVIKIEN